MMNDFFSYYEILDVDEKATPEAIKSAYRSKALKYHPDRVAEHLKEKSEEIFKQIQEAYDVLSDPEKRKKYDEGLKNVKGGRTTSRQTASKDPLLRVDRNSFKFENILPCACISDYLVIFNDGGGTLSGTITTDKPWVTVSDVVVNVADYQDITITVDALSLRPGFSDSAVINIMTDSGGETVTVEIAVDASPLTLFIFYVKPIVNSRAWLIATILSLLLLIGSLIYHFFSPAPAVSETSCPRQTFTVFTQLPKPGDFEGEWYSFSRSWRHIVLFLVPQKDHVEGTIVVAGIIGKINGKIKGSGEIVFKIESYDDLFKDYNNRGDFLKSLSSPFTGKLSEGRIKISAPENFEFSKIEGSPEVDLMNSLLPRINDDDKLRNAAATYNVGLETAWDAVLNILEHQKEKICYENKEKRIIVTSLTKHFSLLGNYAHKYIIYFEPQCLGGIRVSVMQIRYTNGLLHLNYSLAWDPGYTTGVYFFIPLEK